VGDQAVQVLRTYPARKRAIPFAPDGERSIARAYRKALGRARALAYVADDRSQKPTIPLCLGNLPYLIVAQRFGMVAIGISRWPAGRPALVWRTASPASARPRARSRVRGFLAM
jgi:hypothetical protein